MAQDDTQKQEESTMSVMLWTGGALLVVALLAIYAAM
jgi:cobalamin biosynthesis Mg chelatase CobN